MRPFLAILLGACTHPPVATQPPLVIPAKFDRAEDVLAGSWTWRAMASFAAMVAPERITGSIMMPMSTHSGKSPRVGCFPYVTWVPKEPRVGELIEVEWTTLAMGAPRDWPAIVLCNKRGTRSRHVPSGIEVDGVQIGDLGTLFVDLHEAKWLAPGGEGAMLSRRPEDAGRIRLRWTPTQDQVGEVWYFHLVCFGLPQHVAPAGGMLLSPGLRIEIGSARN